MREYLDKQKLLMALNDKYHDMSAMSANYYAGFQYAMRLVEMTTPEKDVASVVHAKWEWHGPCHDSKGIFWATCSACKTRQRLGDYEKYCPKCGAKRDLEDDK